MHRSIDVKYSPNGSSFALRPGTIKILITFSQCFTLTTVHFLHVLTEFDRDMFHFVVTDILTLILTFYQLQHANACLSSG